MDQKPGRPDFPYFPDQLPERYREFTPPVWVEKPGLRPALNPFPAAKAHPFFGRQLGKWPFAFVLLLGMVGTVFLFTTGTVSQVAFAALIATAFITGFLFVTFVVIALTATVLRELGSRLKPTGNPTVSAIPSFRGVSIVIWIVFAIISVSARNHHPRPSAPPLSTQRQFSALPVRIPNYRPIRIEPIRTRSSRSITPETESHHQRMREIMRQLEEQRFTTAIPAPATREEVVPRLQPIARSSDPNGKRGTDSGGVH